MHRFFVEPKSINSNSITIHGDTAKQISKVLRLRKGESIVVMDNSGMEYSVELSSISDSYCSGFITQTNMGTAEPKIKVRLFQSILKADKFDSILQKGTELGVSRFVPFYSERTIPRSPAKLYESKSPRWNKIILEAAEQCGRSKIPLLDHPIGIKEAISSAEGLVILAWENMKSTDLGQILMDNQTIINEKGISIFIGPEGGFSSEEVEDAKSKGVIIISLGNRLLRSDTAGLALSAVLMYELGDLGKQTQD